MYYRIDSGRSPSERLETLNIYLSSRYKKRHDIARALVCHRDFRYVGQLTANGYGHHVYYADGKLKFFDIDPGRGFNWRIPDFEVDDDVLSIRFDDVRIVLQAEDRCLTLDFVDGSYSYALTETFDNDIGERGSPGLAMLTAEEPDVLEAPFAITDESRLLTGKIAKKAISTKSAIITKIAKVYYIAESAVISMPAVKACSAIAAEPAVAQPCPLWSRGSPPLAA